MFSEERKVQIGKALWTASATRQFLLDLKAKFAGEHVCTTVHVHVLVQITTDGQKVAKKLSSQITNETKGIKALLPEYNACLPASGVMESVNMKQALNPTGLATHQVLH